MAPVGRDLAKCHETFFLSYRAQTGIGPKAGQGLAKTRLKCCCEIADAIVPCGTVETVACGAVFE